MKLFIKNWKISKNFIRKSRRTIEDMKAEHPNFMINNKTFILIYIDFTSIQFQISLLQIEQFVPEKFQISSPCAFPVR